MNRSKKTCLLLIVGLFLYPTMANSQELILPVERMELSILGGFNLIEMASFRSEDNFVKGYQDQTLDFPIYAFAEADFYRSRYSIALFSSYYQNRERFDYDDSSSNNDNDSDIRYDETDFALVTLGFEIRKQMRQGTPFNYYVGGGPAFHLGFLNFSRTLESDEGAFGPQDPIFTDGSTKFSIGGTLSSGIKYSINEQWAIHTGVRALLFYFDTFKQSEDQIFVDFFDSEFGSLNLSLTTGLTFRF